MEITAEHFQNAVVIQADGEHQQQQIADVGNDDAMPNNPEPNPDASAAASTQEQNAEANEPSFFDKLQSDEPAPVSTTDQPNAAAQVELPDEVKARLEKLRQIEESPAGKLFSGEYDLTKIPIKELGKRLAGEDFSTQSNEALLRKAFEKQGLQGEDLEQAVSDNLKDNFSEEVPQWKQKLERNKLLNQFESEHKPDEVFNSLEQIQKAQMTNPEQVALQAQQEMHQKVISDRDAIVNQIEALGAELEGQEYMGVKFTAEDAKALASAFKERTEGFKFNRHVMDLIQIVKSEAIAKAQYQKGFEAGKKEAANPNPHTSATNPIVSRQTTSGLKTAKPEDFANATVVNGSN